MVSPIIIGVVIVSIIVVFVIFLIVGVELYNSSQTSFSTVTSDNLFLGSCAANTCAAPFVCDGSTYLCKLPQGASCDRRSQCTIDSFCSGVCVSGPTGQLNQFCPCDEMNICTTQINGVKICKGRGNSPCMNDTDCASNFCNNSVCTSGFPNSFPCATNSDCSSNNCSIGFCQPPGFITGLAGSSCAGSCVAFAGATCNSSSSAPLQCSCNRGLNNPGTCAIANQGLLDPCNLGADCVNTNVCYDNTTNTICQSNNLGCACFFPYPNPDVPPQGKSCINGMINVGGSCFNSIGLGCDVMTPCGQGTCQGGSVLAMYRFAPDRGTRFQGALDTTIVTTPGPAGLIQPSKMFGFSNAAVDTIFLVDQVQGLAVISYDTSTNTVTQPWNIAIPHQSTSTVGGTQITRTLIDAAYNSSTFVVVYQETRISGSSMQQASVVYSGNTLTSLTPFNIQPGPGFDGTQYYQGQAIVIEYIDISPSNSISLGGDILLSSQGTYYRKLLNDTQYTIPVIIGGPRSGMQAVGTTGPPRFYFDVVENSSGVPPATCPGVTGGQIMCSAGDNFALINPYPLEDYSVTQVVQFSGNISTFATPIDQLGRLNYRVFDYSVSSSPISGMSEGGIITLSQVTQNNGQEEVVIGLSSGRVTVVAPYRASVFSRSLATQNRFYVISLASCVA